LTGSASEERAQLLDEAHTIGTREANATLLERYRVPTWDFDTGQLTERRYPRAKVIDMVFFIEGANR